VKNVVKAVLLDRLLARLGRSGPRVHPRPLREPRTRPRLLAPMLAFLAVGVPLMVLFESALTRVIGIACLFGFIVTGVFAIADPAFIDDDEA
jgi:hypothetical protein